MTAKSLSKVVEYNGYANNRHQLSRITITGLRAQAKQSADPIGSLAKALIDNNIDPRPYF